MKLIAHLLVSSVIAFAACGIASTQSGNGNIGAPAASPQTASNMPMNKTPDRVRIDFNIKDVRLASNYSEVLKKLGKPNKSETRNQEVCGEEKFLSLTYPGLTIELIPENENPKNFIVQDIEVTEKNWTFEPGILVGSTIEDVKAKLGQPYHSVENDGEISIFYSTLGGDAAGFTFRDGKLVSMDSEINLC